MRKLSCAARTYNIYVVVNLPERFVNDSSKEDDTDLIYNTNVVFDRQGNIIARYLLKKKNQIKFKLSDDFNSNNLFFINNHFFRYRKYNLFVEPGFSKTDTAELIKFKTDFGVTFGTFICFDIMFKTPSLDLLSKHEDVTDIVYPTAWFSELPFLTGLTYAYYNVEYPKNIYAIYYRSLV